MNDDEGGLMGTLRSKMGPFPVWVWLALITVVLLGWYLYEQHKAGAAGTPTAQPTPAQVGQPGVVVINQGDVDTDPGSPPPEPKHGPKGDKGAVPQDPHKVTRAEARELLGQEHTVYTRNRGGTYVPVTSLSGVHDQLYVGERAWKILQGEDKGARGGRHPAGAGKGL